MVLEASTLEVVASGGLAEDVNPRVLQAGSWLQAENVAPDKGGAFKKRRGYYELATYVGDQDYVVGDAVNSCPLHVGVSEQGPFVFQVSPQDGENGLAGGQNLAPPFVATLDVQGRWRAKDDVPPFVITRDVGLRAHQDFVGMGTVQIGTVRYTVGVLYRAESGVLLPIILRGVDMLTGAVVQDDIEIGSFNSAFALQFGFSIRTMSSGGRVVVVYPFVASDTTCGYAITLYEHGTGSFATTVMVPSTSGVVLPSISEAPGYGGSFESITVCYADGDTLHVREWQIGSVGAGVFVTSYSFVESDNVESVEVSTVKGTTDLYVSYTVKNGESSTVGKTKTLAVHESAPNTWATKWGPVVIDNDHKWNFLTNGIASGYLTTVGRDPSGPISAASLIYVTQNSAGLYLSTERLVGALIPVARPFTWRGKLYLPTLARGDGFGGSPYVGAIVHLRAIADVGHPQANEPAALVGTFAVGEWGTPNFTIFKGPNFAAPLYGHLTSGVCFATPVLNGINQSAIDIVNVAGPGTTWLRPTTTCQGLVVIPGGLTSYFDGQGIFEAGFIEAPTIVDSENIDGAGPTTLGPGDYVYTAVWEYYDATGLLHYSQPSLPRAHRITGEGADAVLLTVQTDRIGRRARRIDGEHRPVRLVVYRTKANSSGPFFRLMSPTIEKFTGVPVYNDYVVNERFTETITFQDTTTDLQIDDRAYGLFPFDLAGNVAGRLNSDPPPPSTAALSHKGRLWLASGDNPHEVWFSQLLESGLAPMFSGVNRIYLSDTTEEITGLAALADRVLIFTRNRIYAIDGDGPDNTGNGTPFRDPYPFSLEIGCTAPKSIVSTPNAVLFAHSPYDVRGVSRLDVSIYQVTQDLQITRISGPVEETLATQCEVQCAWHMPGRGLVGFGVDRRLYEDEQRAATHLIWCYWTNTWVTWRTPNWQVSGGCVWRGEHLLALTTTQYTDTQYPRGSVWTEGGWADPPFDGASQWIGMTLRTPWLHPGALAGYARTRRVQVFGDVPDADSSCLLRVRLDHSHVETSPGTDMAFTISPAALRQFPLVRVETVVAYQKANAIRVTVVDEAPGADSYGPGVTISAISLEIAGKKGLAKLAKSNRGRDTV